MSKTDLLSILRTLSDREGITDGRLATLNKALKAALPEDYQTFLRLADGAEGYFGASYISLSGADDLIEADRILGDLYPNLLIFGTDGGDRYYTFDIRKSNRPVVSFSTGEGESEARFIAPNFLGFLERVYVDPGY